MYPSRGTLIYPFDEEVDGCEEQAGDQGAADEES